MRPLPAFGLHQNRVIHLAHATHFRNLRNQNVRRHGHEVARQREKRERHAAGGGHGDDVFVHVSAEVVDVQGKRGEEGEVLKQKRNGELAGHEREHAQENPAARRRGD